MLFNAPFLAATAALIVGATAAPGADDVFSALLRRQEPGSPAYECHSNCGTAITLSKSEDNVCESQEFLDDYALCLLCAGPDDYNIWRYYGGSLTPAGTKCGLSTTPGAAAPAETTAAPAKTTAAPVETSAAAPVETPAETTAAAVETSAPAQTSSVNAVSSSVAVESSSVAAASSSVAVVTSSSAVAVVSSTVDAAPSVEETSTVTVTSCSSTTTAVVVPVGTGSVVVPSSNGTLTTGAPTAPTPEFTGAAAANGVFGGAFAAVVAVAALAL